ncbi:hypothetical protein B0H17DRAFT_1125593 [Mycena rosella]|uniref:Uncharacterized protein n=1 Tax=Mycena rosella TaxID=1033263 RepID=A0AAD7M9L6_MYCRO|nr:hypothetical protein B0H17DRAFT_1125593 [Mycena rosella]
MRDTLTSDKAFSTVSTVSLAGGWAGKIRHALTALLRRKLPCRTHWALCIDTSPIESTASKSTSYADSLRAAADSAALAYFLPGEFAFEGDAVRVPIAEARIFACKTAYHRSGGGQNMQYLTRVQMAATSPPAPPSTTTELSSFCLRPAVLAVLHTLERLVCALRATAEIFTPLAPRRPPHVLCPAPTLEKRDTPEATPRVVAAAAGRLNGSAAAAFHPMLWDGGRLRRRARLLRCARRAALGDETRDAAMERVHRSPAVPPAPRARTRRSCVDVAAHRLVTLRWNVSAAPSLRRWLPTHELAVEAPESPSYHAALSPSLARFFAALPCAHRAPRARCARPRRELHRDVALHIPGGAVSGGTSSESTYMPVLAVSSPPSPPRSPHSRRVRRQSSARTVSGRCIPRMSRCWDFLREVEPHADARLRAGAAVMAYAGSRELKDVVPDGGGGACGRGTPGGVLPEAQRRLDDVYLRPVASYIVYKTGLLMILPANHGGPNLVHSGADLDEAVQSPIPLSFGGNHPSEVLLEIDNTEAGLVRKLAELFLRRVKSPLIEFPILKTRFETNRRSRDDGRRSNL